jgi:hypothetical protein
LSGSIVFLTVPAAVCFRKAWQSLETYFLAKQIWFPPFLHVALRPFGLQLDEPGRVWVEYAPVITEVFYRAILDVVFTAIDWACHANSLSPCPAWALPIVTSSALVSAAGMGVATPAPTPFAMVPLRWRG